MKKFICYYKVGVLLHWITLSNLFVGIYLSYLFSELSFPSLNIDFFLWCFGISFFFTNVFLAEMDAYSRYQNYKQINDQIVEFGWQKRIIKPMLPSRCQRDAAFVACQKLKLGEECKNYFSSFGYKWFHIIPDFVFKNPSFFFSLYFWRTTFFTPYYKSKYKDVN